MRHDIWNMKAFRLALLGAGLGLSLGACSDRLIEAPPLGNAVQQNMSAQIVNPKPVATDVAPEMNGERDALALTRYEKGKVIKPREIRTSDVGGGAGGGGGSGSGNSGGGMSPTP